MARTVQQLFDLSGKTALITGGSSGVGLQLAHALGEVGARVMLSARKADDLEQACAELQAAGIDARWVAADCAKDSDIQRLTEETLQRMGDVDILVNNAGVTWGVSAEDPPAEVWDQVMKPNLRAYFLLSQCMAQKSMIPRHRGRIIHVASMASWSGKPDSMAAMAYSAAKGAVLHLTRTLGAQWSQHRITVNAICPGASPNPRAAAAPRQPLADDEYLKGPCLLYASDAGQHITGQWLAVDGGASLAQGG